MKLYSRSQRSKTTPPPTTQEAEAGEFVRPRPFVLYIENLDSKNNQTLKTLPGLMVQTCDPIYLGSYGRRITSSRPAWAMKQIQDQKL